MGADFAGLGVIDLELSELGQCETRFSFALAGATIWLRSDFPILLVSSKG